jgi:hypothetical protein
MEVFVKIHVFFIFLKTYIIVFKLKIVFNLSFLKCNKLLYKKFIFK